MVLTLPESMFCLHEKLFHTLYRDSAFIFLEALTAYLQTLEMTDKRKSFKVAYCFAGLNSFTAYIF